ncbi:MAG TPA: hypothetical protein VFE01_01495 [Terracidiphilus sp.]|jgi:hypothetical protein|nr:hypothetical protein [Terracidiphilus sp.]
MPTNGYNSAFEQATEERAEIRVKIEQLLTRGEMLDKLLECLEPFISVPKPGETVHSASGEMAVAGHQEEHHEQQEHHEHQEHHQG